MGRKPKASKEEKIKYCKLYLSGKYSAIQIAAKLNVNESRIYVWANKYKVYGETAFDESNTNKSYTKELKLTVINEYLNGDGTCETLALKYNISSMSVVDCWIKKYNKGIELTDYDPKGDVYTMKSRKTTIEERLEIINYAINNNYDYKGAAEKHDVAYANVYNWVKKFELNGEYGLSDNRGRPTLKTSEMTENEKLKYELEKERAKTARLERAIVALKKNEEIRERLQKNSRKFGM